MIRARGLSYRFRGAARAAVAGVDLDVAAGEIVLLAGPSGSGKSTIARLCAGLLQRHGDGAAEGVVDVAGVDLVAAAPAARVRVVGFVGQEPLDQRIGGPIGDEIAFAAESTGSAAPADPGWARAQLARVGLDLDPERDGAALSGGQLQRLLVGAALAGGAKALVLDEPLAHLDPAGAAELLVVLRRLADQGAAVLLVEHRLAAVAVADRVVLVEHGVVVASAAAADPSWRVDAARLGLIGGAADPKCGPEGPVVLSLRGACHVWPGGGVALDGVDLDVRQGRLAILGANGAGKSTLLAALAGELAARPVGVDAVLVPQDPDLALFSATVREEIAYGPRERGVDVDVDAVAHAFDVAGALDRSPHALSRGQRFRVAVAAAVASAPGVLLLDEPTAGQDYDHVEAVITAASARAGALVFATHDVDLARRHADRVVVMAAGRIVWEGPPDQIPAIGGGEAASAAPRGGLAGLDPRVKLGLLVGVGLLAVLLERPIALAALVAGAAAVLALVAPARLVRGLPAAAVLVWGVVLSQGLFYGLDPRTPAADLGPIVVYREGVVHGFAQSLRFVAVTLAGLAFAASTPAERVIAAFGRLGMPYGLGVAAAAGLRFLPEIGQDLLVVRRARARRGRPVWRRDPVSWLRLEVSLLRPVLARSWRRAQGLAESLDARGFDVSTPRAVHRPLRMGGGDVAVAGVAGGLVLGVFGARVVWWAYVADVAYVPAWRGLYAFVRAWL